MFSSLWNWLFKSKVSINMLNLGIDVSKIHVLITATNYIGTESQLSGCLNDATDYDYIFRNDYKIKNLVSLLGKNYTIENFKDQIDLLYSTCKSGDKVLWCDSSHGTKLPNELNDPNDNILVEEAIVPDNYNWSREGLICESYIRSTAKKFHDKGIKVIMIADACHSAGLGQLDKDLDNKSDSLAIGRFLFPPGYAENIQFMTLAKTLPGMRSLRDASGNHVGILISACGAVQTASDARFNNRANGALTYFLIQVLKEFKFNISYFNLVEESKKRLSNAGYDQIPELDCDDNIKNKVFLS